MQNRNTTIKINVITLDLSNFKNKSSFSLWCFLQYTLIERMCLLQSISTMDWMKVISEKNDDSFDYYWNAFTSRYQDFLPFHIGKITLDYQFSTWIWNMKWKILSISVDYFLICNRVNDIWNHNWSEYLSIHERLLRYLYDWQSQFTDDDKIKRTPRGIRSWI